MNNQSKLLLQFALSEYHTSPESGVGIYHQKKKKREKNAQHKWSLSPQSLPFALNYYLLAFSVNLFPPELIAITLRAVLLHFWALSTNECQDNLVLWLNFVSVENKNVLQYLINSDNWVWEILWKLECLEYIFIETTQAYPICLKLFDFSGIMLDTCSYFIT